MHGTILCVTLTNMKTVPIFGVSECKSLVHGCQITLNLTLHNVSFFTLHNVKVGTFLRSWNVK